MKNISKEDWKSMLSKEANAVVLDVRTPNEWAEGIIPGALKIDYNSPGFDSEVEKLDKSKTYYIYCRSGGRSGQACVKMDKMGFAQTYNLLGGTMDWDGEIVQ